MARVSVGGGYVCYYVQISCNSSIYYFGYLGAAYIHNRLLQHFPQAKYIAVCSLLWGIVLCTMSAALSYKSLLVVRFFMGVLEAVVNCGFVLLTAKWWVLFVS
jgi:ACS family allantoate permease-like MFS transporter